MENATSLLSPFSFSVLFFAFLHPLLHHPAVLLFRIARSSLTADSQTRAARKSAVFIYGIETPPFCIFIILPQLGAGFCIYYVVGRILFYLTSRRDIFLLQRKGKNKKEKAAQRSCTRAIVLFLSLIFLRVWNLHFFSYLIFLVSVS